MPISIGSKRNESATAVLGVLFFLLLIAPLLVSSARANPLPKLTIPTCLGTRQPDGVTKPPIILISAPENHTLYTTSDISLSVNVSIGESKTADLKYIGEIYYQADWQTNKTTIYANSLVNPNEGFYYTSDPQISQFSETLNLTGIPDGNHSLVVYAKEMGTYYAYTDSWANGYDWEYYWNFEIETSLSVFFTVDTTAPIVSILSMQNEIFYTSNVDLSFAVNEQISRTAYSLDGNDNVTITGNTTLNSLSVGWHNVTVYASDDAGNIGASETLTFTVAEAFPTVPVATASVAVAASVSAGILVYFKKLKH